MAMEDAARALLPQGTNLLSFQVLRRRFRPGILESTVTLDVVFEAPLLPFASFR